MGQATMTYEEILDQVRRLDPTEQVDLMEELVALVRPHVTARKPRSILELRGLGKEIWQGIDAQEYVNQERDSWGG